MTKSSFKVLMKEIRACQICAADLPLGPRPILSVHKSAKILIVGQAPGIRVHESGIAWNDPSGERLRDWMGIRSEDFYDAKKVAIVPMGFCYPGTGKSGDLPPRKECAAQWHEQVFGHLCSIQFTILLGQYAQKAILGKKAGGNLTKTVADWKSHRPRILPMPHPSPRNNRWLKINPWFEQEVVPWLRRRVGKLINE